MELTFFLESFQIVQFIGSKTIGILYSGNNLTTVTKILRQLFEIQFIKTSLWLSKYVSKFLQLDVAIF